MLQNSRSVVTVALLLAELDVVTVNVVPLDKKFPGLL